VTIFERAKVVETMLISGDFNESSEQARRILCMDQGSSIRSIRHDRLRFNIDLPPTLRRDDYIVGIRIMVGKAQINAIPASIRIDQLGRSRSLTPRDIQRWHDIPFSYDESVSLLHNESNTLQLHFTGVPPPASSPSSSPSAVGGSVPPPSAASSPSSDSESNYPRIDCLEVYTIPRRVLDVAFGAVPASPARPKTPTPSTPATAGASTAVRLLDTYELSTVLASSDNVPREKVTQSAYHLVQTIWQSLTMDHSSLATPFKNELIRALKPSISASPTAGATIPLVDMLKRPPTLRFLGLPEDLFRLLTVVVGDSGSSHNYLQVALFRDALLVGSIREQLADRIQGKSGRELRELLYHSQPLHHLLGDLSLVVGSRGDHFRELVHRYHRSHPDDSRSFTNSLLIMMRGILEDPTSNTTTSSGSAGAATPVSHFALIQCLLRMLWECLCAMAPSVTNTTSPLSSTTTSASSTKGLSSEPSKTIDLLRDILFTPTLSHSIRTAAVIQFIQAFGLNTRAAAIAAAYDDRSSNTTLTEDFAALRNAKEGKLIKYRCDHCSQFPISTIRWRCQDRHCQEFDLCDDCHRYVRAFGEQSTHRHSHPMERLPIETTPLTEEKKERLYDRVLCPPGNLTLTSVMYHLI
jgi:hypothetical protein